MSRPEPVVVPPPQADSPSAITALAAIAIFVRLVFIVSVPPLLVRSLVEPGLSAELSGTRIEGVAKTVPEQVEGQHGDEDR